jgi:hypothetical protein
VASRRLGSVPGQLHEVELVRDRDRAGEVGEEDEARLQERDEDQVAVRVVDRNLGTQLRDAAAQLISREEDLPDACVI